MTVLTQSKAQLPKSASFLRRKTNVWLALIAILIWQLIALAFVETVLYICGLGEEDIYRLDPEIGYVHFPNKRVTWQSEGYSRSYFNSEGMREPGLTVAKPVGMYRVALLGDSIVESLQVPIGKTFGHIMENRLTQRLHRPVQVINFGNSGYSTSQDYMLLNRKVFAYKPDLVICAYSNRDMFENEAPPDQSITNVRPVVSDVAGDYPVVDSSFVHNWLKTPRAQFLLAIDWFRQNSRICGLVLAKETQMSLDDPIYRFVIDLWTNPEKTLDQLQTIEPVSALLKWPGLFSQKPEQASRLPIQVIVQPPPSLVSKTTIDLSEKSKYLGLMTRTMGLLLRGMKKKCAEHGASFAVLITPSRFGLLPDAKEGQQFFGITYDDEIRLVTGLCQDNNIPVIDAETAALQLSIQQRTQLFYYAHLRAQGHSFMAKLLEPFLSDTIGPHDAR